MSDANRIRMSYIAEDTYGETKTGSNLQTLRLTGESVKMDTDTTSSNELRSDRQTSDIIRNNISASGSIEWEMSYGAYDDLIAAWLMSSGWSSPVSVTATTIAAVNATNSITDSGDGFGTLVAGQWIKVSGFDTAANNGYFKIETAAAGEITVSGGTLTDESAGESVTIQMGGQVTQGTTSTSFNIERAYTDIAGEFVLNTGMMVSSGSMNISPDQIITGSFDFLGRQAASMAASAGTGYTAAPTNSVMNAIDNVNVLLSDGSSFSAREFSLSLNNNLRTRLQIGHLGAISIGTGTVDVTGSLTAYFQSSADMDKYRNFTTTSIAIALEDVSGNGYVIELPSVKFTDGTDNASGKNTDIMATLNWSAFMDATEGITIRIARFPIA